MFIVDALMSTRLLTSKEVRINFTFFNLLSKEVRERNAPDRDFNFHANMLQVSWRTAELIHFPIDFLKAYLLLAVL